MNGSLSGEDELEYLFQEILRQLPVNCQQEEVRCDESDYHVFLMGYGFLFVFALALIGNCLNLVVYKSDQIRFYLAIRMLCTRLLMNISTMLFLLPQALRTVGFWARNGPFDRFFWSFYPYQAYFVNVFGFCAMWLTVLMTGECYLHVFFPSRSKTWCTKRNLTKCYTVMLVIGAVLALNYPLNRTVDISEDRCRRTVVAIVASQAEWVQALERFHTILHLLLAIMMPMSLLVFMTMAIVWRLLLRRSDLPNTSHFTSEKRAVTRITLLTTALQLVSELPPIPVFIYAALRGPSVINDKALCIWNTTGIFFGLCNMSVSFFLYVALSNKFRQMVVTRLSDMMCSHCKSRQDNRPIKPTTLGIEPERSTSRTLLGTPARRSEDFGYGKELLPLSLPDEDAFL